MDPLEYVVFVGIIVLGILSGIVKVKLGLKTTPRWKWINYGFASICFLWAVIFTFILLLTIFEKYDILLIRNWLIRPAILITLSLILASGIARLRTNEY